MNSLFKILMIVTFSVALLAIVGCEKKSDTPEVKEENTQEEPAKIEEAPEEITEPESLVVQIPDLIGKWSGKFDSRNTVLNITEQTDSSFKGKITISYREVINQEVEGVLSPSTMRITMKDLLHSRFRGRYSGKLSEDGQNYSGTFTMDLDKSQFSFNLSRK